MKKIIILTAIALPILFGSCDFKKNQHAEEQPTTPTEETRSGNPYISDNQAEETPVQGENLSGEVIALTAEEFTKRVTDVNDPNGFRYKGYTPCIVDFYADWCGPCQQIKPMISRMAAKYKGELIIYKINVDRAHEICNIFDIQSIPTLMFFSRDEQPRKIVGAPSESDLETAINDFLSK